MATVIVSCILILVGIFLWAVFVDKNKTLPIVPPELLTETVPTVAVSPSPAPSIAPPQAVTPIQTAGAVTTFLPTITTPSTTPTPATPGISGTISFNGTIPSNSYATIAQRITGSGNFTQVIGNISATNGVSWSWVNAQSGTSYDVQAYLWVNNQPYSQSNIATVTAPSASNTLTINTAQLANAPSSSTISVSCGGAQNNLYQATVTYNSQASLSSPQSYNVVITLVSSGTQAMNTTVTPSNPNTSQTLTTSYILTSGATYQAQYAYNTSSNSTYSSLSSPIQFSCG